MTFPSPAFLPAAGAQVPAGIQALQAEAMNTLQKAFAAAKPVWPLFAQELKFNTAGKVVLFAVDRTWDLEPWNGTPKVTDITVREIDAQAIAYTKPVGIDAFTFRDDHIKAYAGEFEIMGCNMALFPDRLLASAMFNGTSAPCYDGADFFSASHPVNPENPSQFGSQSNYFTATSLTWSNYAYSVQPALDGMLAANGRPWMQGAQRKRKLVVPSPYDTIAKQIVHASFVPSSLQNPDATYGVASTENTLKGTAEVIQMVDLDPYINSSHIPWFLLETALAPFSPFGVAMREPFKIIPQVSEDLPIFAEQHKYIWQPYGRLAAVPTVYQSAVMAVS